ncbi:MAG: hypothetical protein E5X35_15145 [Mesorhizobium sp.]|uniref:hypothetical protein n=1 Tax=Mesorhizobium sp. TaxID=1871066 RepID=UPI0012085792|nr:hypothetical protein [Mesorhizobium sp.]TIR32257.1 MAG: hypothetical protein E5X35_15145 [Mesorhizobium sp.]
MARSLIIKSPSAMAAGVTNPTLTRDGLLNAGSLWLIDAMRLGCWDPAVDAVANDAQIGNLVEGSPAALLKVPVVGDITFDAAVKGFKLKATVGLGRIQIGTGTQYFQTDLDEDYLISTMVTYPAVDPGGGHVGYLITKNTATSYSGAGPWMAHRYAANYLFASMDAVASTPTAGTAAGAPNGLEQVAFAKVGANLLYFKNGAQVGSTPLRATPLAANSTPLNWGNGGAASQYAAPGLVMHRTYGENLTVSGRTAAAVVAQEYEQNIERFAA